MSAPLSNAWPDDASAPRKRFKYFQFMGDTATETTDSESKKHLQQYFKNPCLPEDADPLNFWKNFQYQSPEMAKLAC